MQRVFVLKFGGTASQLVISGGRHGVHLAERHAGRLCVPARLLLCLPHGSFTRFPPRLVIFYFMQVVGVFVLYFEMHPNFSNKAVCCA